MRGASKQNVQQRQRKIGAACESAPRKNEQAVLVQLELSQLRSSKLPSFAREDMPQPTTTAADSSIPFAGFTTADDVSAVSVDTLFLVSSVSTERDRRALLSTPCRRKTSSDMWRRLVNTLRELDLLPEATMQPSSFFVMLLSCHSLLPLGSTILLCCYQPPTRRCSQSSWPSRGSHLTTLEWSLPPLSRRFCSLPMMFSTRFFAWCSVLSNF